MTPPSPPPVKAVIVRTLDEALAALDAAREAGVAVTLLSPPGAAGTMGAGFWQALIEAAAEERPDARFTALLDCGPWPGFAMAALRQGVKGLVFTGDAETLTRLRGIAEACGATILDRAPAALDPAALDPDTGRNQPAALRVWLAGERRDG
ncbi:hypothetical protein [Oceanibaculum sp.]|uniref:hypothetical protein n=1 Tax=Oceanibaculum sp. TaxID=1903597 RepID=UPI00258B8436|nr:hypothetical protein [Oceanibaculum sp.]MCH2393309.1 hypothetical protein [Oceanibaculum sp.]